MQIFNSTLEFRRSEMFIIFFKLATNLCFKVSNFIVTSNFLMLHLQNIMPCLAYLKQHQDTEEFVV